METLSNITPDILTVDVADANPAWIGEALQTHAERGASLGNLFVARLAYELITLDDGNKPLVGSVEEYLVKVGRGMHPLPGSTDRFPHKPAHFGETPRKALRGIEPIISSADDADLLASLAAGEMGWKAAAERFAERVELRGTVANMLTEGQALAAQARDRAAAFADKGDAFVAALAVMSAMLGGLESAAKERPVPNKDGAFASLNALKAAAADVMAVARSFDPDAPAEPESTVPSEPTSTAIAEAVAEANAAEVERIEQAAAETLAARETANDAADTRTETERNRDAFVAAVAAVEAAYAALNPADVLVMASHIDALANVVDAARVTLAAAAESKAGAKGRKAA